MSDAPTPDLPAPEAPIHPDRLPVITALLGWLSADVGQSVDPAALAGDPARVAADISTTRLVADVEQLAATPRPWDGDWQAAASAAGYIEHQFRAAGYHPELLPVTYQQVELPVVFVRTAPTEPPTEHAPDSPLPTVVLVAHYDTVPGSPGADDNASGVAAVLEIARVLAATDLPGSVVLAAVPFEESGGLAGSTALAERLVADPVLRLEAAISAEMIGFATSTPRIPGDDGGDLILIGYPGTDHAIGVLCAASRAVGAGRVRGLAVPEQAAADVIADLARSDHAAFHAVGVPAVMATDGAEYRNPNYHQPSDTPQTLDPAFLTDSTRVLAVGLMALLDPAHRVPAQPPAPGGKA